MGNGESALLDQYRKSVSGKEVQLRVLLLGHQGHGKTSLMNTLYSAASQTYKPADNCVGGAGVRGSSTIRVTQLAVPGMEHVKFIDAPGCSWATEKHALLLKRLLDGVAANTIIRQDENSGALLDDINDETVPVDETNKIDFVVVVVNASSLQAQNPAPGWFGPRIVLSPGGAARMEQLYKLIKDWNQLRAAPVVVYTFKDKLNISADLLKEKTFPTVNQMNKYLIHCYDYAADIQQPRADTDAVAMKLLDDGMRYVLRAVNL